MPELDLVETIDYIFIFLEEFYVFFTHKPEGRETPCIHEIRVVVQANISCILKNFEMF